MLKPIFSSPNNFIKSKIFSGRTRDFSWGVNSLAGGLLEGLEGLAPPQLVCKKGPDAYDRYFYESLYVYLYQRCFLTKGVVSGGPQNAFLFYRTNLENIFSIFCRKSFTTAEGMRQKLFSSIEIFNS